MGVIVDIEMPEDCTSCKFKLCVDISGHGYTEYEYRCLLGYIPRIESYSNPEFHLWEGRHENCKLEEYDDSIVPDTSPSSEENPELLCYGWLRWFTEDFDLLDIEMNDELKSKIKRLTINSFTKENALYIMNDTDKYRINGVTMCISYYLDLYTPLNAKSTAIEYLSREVMERYSILLEIMSTFSAETKWQFVKNIVISIFPQYAFMLHLEFTAVDEYVYIKKVIIVHLKHILEYEMMVYSGEYNIINLNLLIEFIDKQLP